MVTFKGSVYLYFYEHSLSLQIKLIEFLTDFIRISYGQMYNLLLLGAGSLKFKSLRLSSSGYELLFFQHIEVLFENSNLKKLASIC